MKAAGDADMKHTRRRDLVAENSATLGRYPTLLEVYGTEWVRQQVPTAFKRGPHPMLNWLSAPPDWQNASPESRERKLYDQCEATLGRMDAVLHWAMYLGPQAGKVKSRLKLLRGQPKGSWDDNHRDWWTTLCELYLAHWLQTLGYDIRMGDQGADIELSKKDTCVLVEITTLRKGLGVSELEGVLSWHDSCPYGVVVRYDTEEFRLTEQEFGKLLSEFDEACASMTHAGGNERTVKLRNSTGMCEIRIANDPSPWIHTTGPTKGFAIRFEHLYDKILEKIHQKVGRKQLNLDQPSVLVIDIETWRPSAVTQFRLSQGGVMADFPVGQLPASAAALMMTTISPLSGRPTVLTITPNPQSPFRCEPALHTLFDRIGTSLRQIDS